MHIIQAKHGSLSRARGVVYRALQSCPWARVLYTDAVAVFGDGELQQMADLMVEKELRVHVPLEEMDLLIDAQREDGGEEDGVKEEEIEDEEKEENKVLEHIEDGVCSSRIKVEGEETVPIVKEEVDGHVTREMADINS